MNLHCFADTVSHLLLLIPECVAQGSHFTWGLGVGTCRSMPLLRPQASASVRKRPQPSATVRNRPQPSATVRNVANEFAMAVPMTSSAKVVTFGGFKRRVASFHAAGVALCDIPTCFITCRKWFCVAGAILLRCFQKMSCIFCSRRSTLENSIVILRGRRSTSDVSLCVFFANTEYQCQGCVRW